MRAIIQRAWRRDCGINWPQTFKKCRERLQERKKKKKGARQRLSGATKQGPKAISQTANSSGRVWRSGHKTNPCRPRRQEEAANGLISPPLTGLIPPFSSSRNIHGYWEAKTGGERPCGNPTHTNHPPTHPTIRPSTQFNAMLWISPQFNHFNCKALFASWF